MYKNAHKSLDHLGVNNVGVNNVGLPDVNIDWPMRENTFFFQKYNVYRAYVLFNQ